MAGLLGSIGTSFCSVDCVGSGTQSEDVKFPPNRSPRQMAAGAALSASGETSVDDLKGASESMYESMIDLSAAGRYKCAAWQLGPV